MKPEYERLSPLSPTSIGLTGIEFNTSDFNSIIIDYSISRGLGKKKGELHIVTDGVMYDWYENIIEIGSPSVDINFDVGFDGSNIVVYYTDDADTIEAQLHWSARSWNHSFNNYGSF
ncbi:MAG: hypothetical protein HC836_43065 [Richelia sp. RM2_1_2]|nr:hypothetical protein [Richelia sp. RM2_1_2]